MDSHQYPLTPLIADHHAALGVAHRLLLVLWIAVVAGGLLASCTVYRNPTGEFIGAIGGRGHVGPQDDPLMKWNNDASFKDASRVVGTGLLAPALEKGVEVFGNHVTGRTANEGARIAADQAVEQAKIDAAAEAAAASAAASN